MRHRIELPEALGPRFSVKDAAAHGIGRRRQEAPDLSRPFRGIRAVTAPKTLHDHALAYAPRLRPGQSFGGATALHLCGLPHPTDWTSDTALVIVVETRASVPPPRAAGVRGRRLAKKRFRRWKVGALPIVDAVAALFMCASELEVAQIVTLIDAIVTSSDHYPDRVPGFPRTTLDEVTARFEEWQRFPGRDRVEQALGLAREKVESPKETESRLAIVNGGIPEPLVQYEVFDGRRFVARVDLAYPELKIAIEYEGDGHRTDKMQWRRDIARQRELEALGWIVIRITELDLADDAAALLASVRAARARRLPRV